MRRGDPLTHSARWGSFHEFGGGLRPNETKRNTTPARKKWRRRTAPRRRPEARRHAHPILTGATATPPRCRQLCRRAVCSATLFGSSTSTPSALLPACAHCRLRAVAAAPVRRPTGASCMLARCRWSFTRPPTSLGSTPSDFGGCEPVLSRLRAEVSRLHANGSGYAM